MTEGCPTLKHNGAIFRWIQMDCDVVSDYGKLGVTRCYASWVQRGTLITFFLYYFSFRFGLNFTTCIFYIGIFLI